MSLSSLSSEIYTGTKIASRDFESSSTRVLGAPNAPVGAGVNAAQPETGNAVGQALDTLTKYIPIEIITPYVTVLAASATLSWLPENIRLVALWLTPILLLIIHVSKGFSAGKTWSELDIQFLWWRMAAAVVAFYVWSLVLPTSISTDPAIGARVALQGVLAVLISPALSILEPIADRIAARLHGGLIAHLPAGAKKLLGFG